MQHLAKLVHVVNQGCNYTRKYWSGRCNVVRWKTPEQCCYQGSTTIVEFTMLMSVVRSIVVRCWQKNNSCYNVVGAGADNIWWKKVVDGCQQRLNNDCWSWTTVNNGCWQQLVQQNIATSCRQHWSSCSFLRERVLIQIFVFCPTNFFWNQLFFKVDFNRN